ncbi:MAG TPA: alkaline phosphatase D family protein [Candidatus Tectomicrobia bacterium]|nr:alkaline phosphatase D family protein [Candidatus Tectomicrobia bacterium]
MTLHRAWLRRLAVAALLLGAAPAGLASRAPLTADRESPLLVTVAEVASDRAVLWLRSATHDQVDVTVHGAGEPGARRFAALVAPDWDRTFRVALTGLAPGREYRYEAAAGGEVVTGRFATAPAPDADVPVRLLWSGDLGGSGHCRDAEHGYRIFRAMAERAADLFLFVGDTMYADHTCGGRPSAGDDVATTLEDFRAKHRYNRADPAMQAFLRRTPVYAIWDDHEVRNNFGPAEPLMSVGLRAFRDYWAVAGPADEPDRLYRAVRWGRHVEIFILDTRQYRSPNEQADGPDKTMLGDAQRRWLLDGVRASDATWKVIVTSVPLGMFTGGAASDSWSSANVFGFRRAGRGFAWERDAILGALAAAGVENVVFLAGDVHHAQLLRHDLDGYTVHEMVAGPLAARPGFPRFLDRSLRSRSLGGVGLTSNFGEIVADGRELVTIIRDTDGRARTSARLTAEPDGGQAP